MQAAGRILQDPQMPREALRILGVLIQAMTWQNRVYLRAKDMAAQLDIHPTNVSRGLALLRVYQVVTRVYPGVYELHPELFHVGRLAEAKQRKRGRVWRERSLRVEYKA